MDRYKLLKIIQNYTYIYTEIKYGKERRLGGRVSLLRVVEEVFPLVKAF